MTTSNARTPFSQFLVGLTLVFLSISLSGYVLTNVSAKKAQSGKLQLFCLNLTQEGTVKPVSGVVLYDCGSSTPAFHIRSSAAITPRFVIPKGTGSVGSLSISLVTTSPCSSLTILTSGMKVSLPVGSYDYCLQYNSFPASGGVIPNFTITWS